MPLVAAIALIVTAVLFVVGIITLIVGFATHRVSMESPLADDDDNDDLSDDTATLLSMLPGASVVVDEHDEVVRCNPAAYRLGVVSDDAIAQQHVLDAIHEARKSGGKRQFDLTHRYSGAVRRRPEQGRSRRHAVRPPPQLAEGDCRAYQRAVRHRVDYRCQ